MEMGNSIFEPFVKSRICSNTRKSVTLNQTRILCYIYAFQNISTNLRNTHCASNILVRKWMPVECIMQYVNHWKTWNIFVNVIISTYYFQYMTKKYNYWFPIFWILINIFQCSILFNFVCFEITDMIWCETALCNVYCCISMWILFLLTILPTVFDSVCFFGFSFSFKYAHFVCDSSRLNHLLPKPSH